MIDVRKFENDLPVHELAEEQNEQNNAARQSVARLGSAQPAAGALVGQMGGQ